MRHNKLSHHCYNSCCSNNRKVLQLLCCWMHILFISKMGSLPFWISYVVALFFISLIIYGIRNAVWISKTLSILVSLHTLRVKPKPNNRCILEHLLLFFFVNFKELKGSLNSVKHELHRNDSSQATSGNPCVVRYIIADKSNIKG